MAITAEELFDGIGEKYEDVYANNPGLEVIMQLALAELKPGSHVLDVGCGTGKPVASQVARAGHNVYGIDVSQKMVDIASWQVSAQPSSKIEAFTITAQVVRHVELPFMGRKCIGTVYTVDGWRNLFQKAGFEIQVEKFFSFTERQPYKDESQEHYLVIARKVVDHALMGPYPLPTSYRGPHPLSEGSWAPFAERLVRDEFDAVLDLLENNQNILDVGSGYGKLPIAIAKRGGTAYSIEPNAERNSLQMKHAHNVKVRVGSAENIPFPDGKFDAVVAMWVLHY
ncbi:hypothetical protein F66182_13153, partial [Fusarium sp. NRRL 66182]